MASLTFEGLRYFGLDGPLAIFIVDGQQRIYDQNGLRDLLAQQMAIGGDVALVRHVMTLSKQQAQWKLPDLSEDDLQ